MSGADPENDEFAQTWNSTNVENPSTLAPQLKIVQVSSITLLLEQGIKQIWPSTFLGVCHKRKELKKPASDVLRLKRVQILIDTMHAKIT